MADRMRSATFGMSCSICLNSRWNMTIRRMSVSAMTEAVLRRKNADTPIYGPATLLDAVYESGRKGISMQRYKGLGEMNPEQLWETTLNTDVRTLLQVKITELDDADEIFSKLMGDVVEPRREFIQENALTVSNLDV